MLERLIEKFPSLRVAPWTLDMSRFLVSQYVFECWTQFFIVTLAHNGVALPRLVVLIRGWNVCPAVMGLCTPR